MSNTDIPNHFYLSPVNALDRYLTLDQDSGVDAILTSEQSVGLIFYLQNTNPVATVDNKICTVGPTAKNETAPPGLCLDQLGNNVTQVALQDIDDVSGQFWNRTRDQARINGADESGWRLQSEFAGSKLWLSVDGDNTTVIMGTNGQAARSLWRFIDSTGNNSNSGNSTSTSSGTTGSSTADSSSDNGKNERKSSGLSAGAIAGIVIAIITAIAIAALIWFFMRRKRRRDNAPVELAATSSTVGRHELSTSDRQAQSSRQSGTAEMSDTHRTELSDTSNKEAPSTARSPASAQPGQVFEMPVTEKTNIREV